MPGYVVVPVLGGRKHVVWLLGIRGSRAPDPFALILTILGRAFMDAGDMAPEVVPVVKGGRAAHPAAWELLEERPGNWGAEDGLGIVRGALAFGWVRHGGRGEG